MASGKIENLMFSENIKTIGARDIAIGVFGNLFLYPKKYTKSIMFLEEPGFCRMPIIRARATKKNAELNAELKKMLN